MNRGAILADVLYILGISMIGTGVYFLYSWQPALIAVGSIFTLTALRYG